MSQEHATGDIELPAEEVSSLSCTKGARSYVQAERAESVALAWTLEFTPLHELADTDGTCLHERPMAATGGNHLDVFDAEMNAEDTAWVPTGPGSERLYSGLAAPQWERIEAACRTENDSDEWEQAVESTLQQFRDWKYNSISQRASFHECIFAQLLGDTTAAIRGFEDDPDGLQELVGATTASHRQVATILRQLSVDIAKTYGLLTSDIYRGLGYHLPEVAEAVFTDPSQTELLSTDEFTVLTNFTLDREVACRFSEIVLEIELSEELLMSAPDFLTHTVVYFHGAAEWRPVPEAEIRVRGDALTEIPRDQITIAGAPNNSQSFPDLVDRLPRSILDYDLDEAPLFTQQEHLALREAALSFADYDYTDTGRVKTVEVTPPDAQAALDRLSVWIDVFDAEFEPMTTEGPNKTEVYTIVEQIIESGRV